MTAVSAFRRAVDLLSRRDRRRLIFLMIAQMLLSLLDVIGVLLLGLAAALLVVLSQGQPLNPLLSQTVEVLSVWGLPEGEALLAIAGVAVCAFLAKTLASALLARRVFIYLAGRQTIIGSNVIGAVFGQPLAFLQIRSSQESSYALTGGLIAAVMLTLGNGAIAIAEASLLVLFSFALLWVNAPAAISAILFFSVVALTLQRRIGRKAFTIAEDRRVADIASLQRIQETLGAYREIFVAQRREYYVATISDLRAIAARKTADSLFLAMLPKYVLELALVVWAMAVAVWLLSSQPLAIAVGTLATFLAAGTRVIPSILRLQGSVLTMRECAGLAGSTHGILSSLKQPGASAHTAQVPATPVPFDQSHDGFDPTIEVQGICFRYPNTHHYALDEVSFRLRAGHSLALVGPSGSGKTTLVDVILGVLMPTSGLVTISGLAPLDAGRRWPGAAAYVPQNVFLASGTLRENVALGLDQFAVSDEEIWGVLGDVSLAKWASILPEGLGTQVGEGGHRMSGGQRQRVGLARALLTRPKLLVLDEATSALDPETEASVASMLANLKGAVTTITIAHRLATVANADEVAYLEDGRLRALGSLSQVQSQVPSFGRYSLLK